MVEAKLKSIFPTIEISKLKQNTLFDFEINVTTIKEHKIILLYTEGLSKRAQDVKKGFEAFKNIELYFCLPQYWNLEKDQWPIEWLERLAAVPQKNETWFGPGDTIPAGNPPQLLTDRFPANHFLLSEPILLQPLFNHPAWVDLNINFLGIIPICQEELDYKLRNSATLLFRKLREKGYSEKVDVFRTSAKRKPFLGII